MTRFIPLIVALAAFVVLALTGSVQAQTAESPVPDRRMVVTQDQDFTGTDLRQMFDTTFDACRSACVAEPACVAFTFNSRAGSCFPKSAVTGATPYAGARSARIEPVSAATKTLARTRAADIEFVGKGTLREALDLARDIGSIHPAGQYGVSEMQEIVRTRRAEGDTLNAMRWTGGIVAASDQPGLYHFKDLGPHLNQDAVLAAQMKEAAEAYLAELRADAVIRRP